MRINELIPELLVENIQKTITFYIDVLGFTPEIIFPEKNPIFVQVNRDGIRIMLYHRSDFEKEIPKLKNIPMGGSALLYFHISQISEFYKSIKNKVKIIQKIHTTPYGSTEFSMEDCNGYLLAFSEKNN